MANIYLDEDGNPISEEELQSGNYEVVDEYEAEVEPEAKIQRDYWEDPALQEEFQKQFGQEEASWADVPKNFLTKGAASTSRAIGGGVEALGDLLGLEGLSGWGAETKDLADMAERGTELKTGLEPGTWKARVSELGKAMPAVAAMPLGAPIVAGEQLLENFGGSYGEYKDLGASPMTAAMGGAGNATLQTGLNLLEMNPFLKAAQLPGVKGAVKRLVNSTLTGLATNPVGAVADLKARELTTGLSPTEEEFSTGIKESMIQAPLQAGVFETARSAPRLLSSIGTRRPGELDSSVLDAGEENPNNPPPPSPEVKEPVLQPVEKSEALKQADETITETDATPEVKPVEKPKNLLTENQESLKAAEAKEIKTEEPKAYQELLPEPTEAGESSPQRQGTQLDLFLKETDDAVLPKVKETFEQTDEHVDDSFSDNGINLVEKHLEAATKGRRFGERDLSGDEKFFRGRVFGKEIPGVSKALEVWRKMMIFPRTVAEKFPEFTPIFEAGKAFLSGSRKYEARFSKILKPFLRLEDKTRVNKLLEDARRLAVYGREVKDDPDTLRQAGLSTEEIRAYASVRRAMDYSLDLIESHRLKTSQDPNEQNAIKAETANWRKKRYVPYARFGDIVVAEVDSAGNYVPMGEVSFHESKRSAETRAKELQALGKNVRVAKSLKPPKEAFDDLPVDVLTQLSKLDPNSINTLASHIPIQGFPNHMLQAKLVPGYNTDFGRSITDYVQGLSRFMAKQDSKVMFDEGFKGLQEGSSLYAYANRYKKYLFNPPKEATALRAFLTAYYLGGNVKSAAVNITQNVTTTVPQLLQYHSLLGLKDQPGVGALGATIKKAAGYSSRYLLSQSSWVPEKTRRAITKGLIKENKTLYKDLTTAQQGGVVDAQLSRSLHDLSKGGGANLMEKLMLFFDTAEKFNRTAAYVAAHETARKLGAKGKIPAGHENAFAQKFVEDTQFIYDRSNRPDISRGAIGSTATTFKLFAGQWIRLLRNNATFQDGKWKSFLGQLGAMGALGGLAAIPGWKEVDKVLQQSGADDYRLAIRKWTDSNEDADKILYGLPTGAGVSISGALATPLLPEFNTDWRVATLSALIGPAADIPLRRIPRANQLLSEYDDRQYLAAEALLPEALRHASVAGRAYAGGGFKDAEGAMVYTPESDKEYLVKALGFTPPKLNREWEKRSIEYAKTKKSKDTENINTRIAIALREGGLPAAQEIFRKFMERQEGKRDTEKVEVNPAQVMKKLEELNNPALGRTMDAPKKLRDEIVEIEKLYRR